MNITVLTILESLFLVIALTTDTFVASFAYGTDKIKIPLSSILIITLISAGTLCLSTLAGSFIRTFFPMYITHCISFFILFVLGIMKLFDSSIKNLIRRYKTLQKQISFSFLHLHFILDVYADPQVADLDLSHTLSPKEAITLALAMSIDGLAVGFGSALMNISTIMVLLFALILGFTAVKIGCFFGNKIATHLTFDLSWLSGVLLIILAIIRL